MNSQLAKAEETFKANAKTFSLAARFLDRDRYEAVARLYAFCRYVDDLADTGNPGSNSEALTTLRQSIYAGQSNDDQINDLLQLKEHHNIPTELILDFVDAIIEDQYPRELQSVDQLVRFSYGVASTVGLMMCHVFEVRNPSAFPFAIDLGIAMQISNISRDILEDAERDRIYIPAELLGAPITCEGLLKGDQSMRDNAYEAAQQLLQIADEYYASAALGYGYLPRSVRHTIKVAARLYQAIGEKISASPTTYWQQRSFVSRRRKCSLILQMLWQRMNEGSSTLLIGKVSHCQQLHKALGEKKFSA
jgi:phytoene synthase